MNQRSLLFATLSAAVMGGSLSVVQAQTPATKPGTPAKASIAAKTPWGDPDISGVWTSDAAIGIPMQRPDQFGGRAELNEDEYAAKLKRDAQTRERAENAIGSFRNDNAWLVKSFRQTSLIVDPPDGKLPAVTPYAESRRATRDQGTFGAGPFDKTEDFTNYDRCITRGIIGSVLPVVYGNGNRILQTPGQVIISYEMVHDTRVIYTDGRPHVGRGIRQLLGDSRGHWEGSTLVIETTNLTDRTSIGLNGNGLRHSEDMVMTERITRVGPDELRYEVTIERSEDLREAVHHLAATDVAPGLSAAAVRMSRRRLRGAERPQRRAHGRSGACRGPEEGRRACPPGRDAGERQRAGHCPAQRGRVRC